MESSVVCSCSTRTGNLGVGRAVAVPIPANLALAIMVALFVLLGVAIAPLNIAAAADEPVKQETAERAAQLFKAAEDLLAEKKFSDADTVASALIDLMPADARGYYLLARARHGNGAQHSALIEYDSAIRLDENLLGVYGNRGWCLVESGYLKEAVPDLERAIVQQPGRGRSYLDRGRIRYLQGQFDAGRADIDRAASLDATDAETQLVQALLLQMHGKTEEALAAFRKVAAMEPHMERDQAAAHIFFLRVAAGERDAAIPELQAHFGPRDVGVRKNCYVVVAAYLLGTIKEEKFLTHMKGFNRLNRNDFSCRAYFYLGLKKLQDGDERGAKEALDECHRLHELSHHEYLCATYLRHQLRYLDDEKFRRGVAKKLLAKKLTTAEEFLDRAIALDLYNKQPEALADLEQAIRLKPNFAKAYLFRGRVKAHLGDLTDALRDFEKAEDLGERSSRLQSERAWAFLKLKLYDKAIVSADKAVEGDPKSGRAYNVRGMIREAMGDQTAALREFANAIEADPNYTWAYNNRGNLHGRMGNRTEAIADYDTAIQLAPDEPQFYNNRGVIRFQLAQLPRAAADFSAAIERDPRMAEAYANRGSVMITLDRPREAVLDLNQAIKLSPGVARSWFMRGRAKDSMGDFRGALVDYSKAIELDPSQAMYHTKRGWIHITGTRYSAALSDFTRALEISPFDHEARSRRADIYSALGDNDAALSDLNVMIKNCPRRCQGHFDRGTTRMLLDDLHGSIDDLSVMIENYPWHTNSYISRAHAKLIMEDYEGAYKDLTQALSMPMNGQAYGDFIPPEALAHFLMGLYYRLHEKAYGEALTHFDRAIALKKDYVWAFIARADARGARKEFKLALADLDVAVRYDATVSYGPYLRGKVKGSLGDHAGAVEDFTLALSASPQWGEAYFQRSMAKERLGDAEAAAADYALALRFVVDNDNTRSKFMRHRLSRIEEGDNSSFQTDFDEIIGSNPDNPYEFMVRSSGLDRASSIEQMDHASFYWRGSIRHQKEDYRDAIADLTAAIDRKPDHAPSFEVRGKAKWDLGDMKGAMLDMNRAIEIDPERAQPYRLRGEFHQRHGDLAAALADFDRAAELDADTASPLVSRGNVLELQGKLEAALASYNRALERDKTNGRARVCRGLYWYRRGEGARAIADLVAATEGTELAYGDVAANGLWLIRAKQGDASADKELTTWFENRVSTRGSKWHAAMADFLLGKTNAEQLIATAKSEDIPQRRTHECEAYYCIGAKRRVAGNEAGAKAMFSKAVATREHETLGYLAAKAFLAE